MPENSNLLLAPMARKLDQHRRLDEADRDAILNLPASLRRLEAGQYLVWDGDRPQQTCLLISGFAVRHKEAGNGSRQNLSIHMRGDVLDLQNSLLGLADHNVQMLTAGDVAVIPVDAMREIAFARPAVGQAMWHETLIEGSIFREWMVNIGRRDARTRIAHLLCEIALRMVRGRPWPFHQLRAADHLGAAGRRRRAHIGSRQPDADEARAGWPDHPHQAGDYGRRLESAGNGCRLRTALFASRTSGGVRQGCR